MKVLYFKPIFFLAMAFLLTNCGSDNDESSARQDSQNRNTTYIDKDNDGVADDIDCNDSDPTITTFMWYQDQDGDGYGNQDTKIESCTAPDNYSDKTGDCNDSDSSIYPGAPELCDDVDNDCNASTPQLTNTTYYADLDADGFGNSEQPIETCEAPTGYVADSTDCDDSNDKVYPEAEEICDDVDNDCNAATAALLKSTYYPDSDNDGFGSSSPAIETCQAPTGFVENATDCDDSNNSVYPGAPEVCDETDNDCDAGTPAATLAAFFADSDDDGFGNSQESITTCDAPPGYVANRGDCDDSNPAILACQIGFLNPSTGPLYTYGPIFRSAAHQAIDDLNAIAGPSTFELLEEDSACDALSATAAAEALNEAGVAAVAGAACSASSIAANYVLGPAGIPMVSYSSSSPFLSDSTTFPHFFRVVPSDTQQTDAIIAALEENGLSKPALVHMTNDYGGNLADAFATNWPNDLCTTINYDEESLNDLNAEEIADIIATSDCDSIVLFSYAMDAAQILESVAEAALEYPIFMSDNNWSDVLFHLEDNMQASHGVQLIKSLPKTTASLVPDLDGLYQAEIYDAIRLIGLAILQGDGATMSERLFSIGNEYEGASGTHTFLPNGDTAGSGFEICTMEYLPGFDQYFNCKQQWLALDGILGAPWEGEEFNIGLLTPLSGPGLLANHSLGFEMAAQIALRWLNTITYNSNIRFNLIPHDSACNPMVASDSALALVEYGDVRGIVGPSCSGAAIAANEALHAAGFETPMISYSSSSPDLSNPELYPNFFRVVPSDNLPALALSQAITTLGGGRIALLSLPTTEDAATSSYMEFYINEAELCTHHRYDESFEGDFGDFVADIMSNDCATAVIIGNAEIGAQAIDQIHSAGFAGKIIGSQELSTQDFANNLESPDVLSRVHAIKRIDPAILETTGAFNKECELHPDCIDSPYTQETFDAVMLMGHAILEHLATGSPVTHAIESIAHDFSGASGLINFQPTGDLAGPGFCMGKFEFDYETSEPTFYCSHQWNDYELTDP